MTMNFISCIMFTVQARRLHQQTLFGAALDVVVDVAQRGVDFFGKLFNGGDDGDGKVASNVHVQSATHLRTYCLYTTQMYYLFVRSNLIIRNFSKAARLSQISWRAEYL